MMQRILIVPAAGMGTRLRSALPKLLVPVAGVPMIDRLLALYREQVDASIVVVSPGAEDAVRTHLRGTAGVVVQPEPTGMLDAILIGRAAAAALQPDSVWITWCDQVGVHPQTIAQLDRTTRDHPDAAIVMPTVRRPAPYIHFDRDGSGRITRVLHRREGDQMPAVGESDMGLFALSRDAFMQGLPKYAADVVPGAGTGERNFLPFIPWAAARGEVLTFPSTDPQEAIGVNTPEELAEIEAYLRSRGD
jgi:bifunctional N-acetylglucosamine-1-phosphate-uridyltransferase/glucosamine-1-phosphate-acetyltransferase GlmU-like protein